MYYPQIEYHGAKDGVTGSCHQLRMDATTSLLIDCGLSKATTHRSLASRARIGRPSNSRWTPSKRWSLPKCTSATLVVFPTCSQPALRAPFSPMGQSGYVDLDGERIDIRADITSIGGYSAHADQKGFVEFVTGMQDWPTEIRVVRREAEARRALMPFLWEGYRRNDLRVEIDGTVIKRAGCLT